MNIQINAFLLIVFIFIGLNSCGDFLDLEPETSLSSAVAFDNIEGIEAGINGAYSIIHSDWVERQYVFSECLAGNVFEVNSLGNSNYQDALRHESWTDMFNTANYLWRMCYQVIDLMNQIIQVLPDIEESNQQITERKNTLLGEALFLRGLQYFVLNRFWANPNNGLSVPLMTSPFQPVDMPPRASIENTQDHIINDLKDAEQLMSGIESNNGRATIWAVKGLLARAYFEFKDYTNAEDYARDVIENGKIEGRTLSLLDGSPESAYGPDITSENIFTFLGSSIDRTNIRLFEMFSLSSSAVELSVSDEYWEIISTEPNDLRIQQLHQDFVVAHACFKYDDREMNMPFIRLPEMYLIAAESSVNNGNLDQGLNDLNRLRQRAGLQATDYIDREDLLSKIFKDRSLELSMEGDNFHNLKRLEQSIGGYPWEEAKYKLVFFIPEKEVQLNENMIQNDIW